MHLQVGRLVFTAVTQTHKAAVLLLMDRLYGEDCDCCTAGGWWTVKTSLGSLYPTHMHLKHRTDQLVVFLAPCKVAKVHFVAKVCGRMRAYLLQIFSGSPKVTSEA